MQSNASTDPGFLGQDGFIRRLNLEQLRTERSRRPFVFVLIESNLLMPGGKRSVSSRIVATLSKSIRETDIRGWYETGAAIGLIFTEIGSGNCSVIGEALLRKVRGLLARELTSDQIAKIRLSYYVYPNDWDKSSDSTPGILYPEASRSRLPAQIVKRCIDICGSLIAITLASPVFLVIAAAVKLTSKGPVLFRQERVGQYGRKFTFLKFRSMYLNNDHGIHREYVKNLIAGSATTHKADAGERVFKLANDPRVTRLGRFLRRTSLDEIPQFLNVLTGEMSLVGPRPPIPYEVESYDIWHRRRLLGVKPGITGLWQVHGRSRTTFDEMVRLDLRYARSWTVWMDLKILLQTPRAVLAGGGAY